MTLEEAMQCTEDLRRTHALLVSEADSYELRYSKLMVERLPILLTAKDERTREIILERHKHHVSIVMAALLRGEGDAS